MKKIVTRILIVLGLLIGSGALITGTALAHGKHDGDKPGWGHGDKNHHHKGPPGKSTKPHKPPKPPKEDKHDKEQDKNNPPDSDGDNDGD